MSGSASNPLSLNQVLRINLIIGAAGGLISAIIFLAFSLHQTEWTEAVLALILIPTGQAVVFVLYGIAGYPIYRYLAARSWFV